MSWQNHFPTKVFFGSHVIVDNCAALKTMGSKALVVLGQGGSARRNGALDDLCRALDQIAVSYAIFDQVEGNPSIETAINGACVAKKEQADFIIGIGGGSPLDAAKAIAILAINPIGEQELFALHFDRVLPIVAIPTTAGTGSEVTPYSILTNPATESKQRIMHPHIIPRLAFLDPRYTMGLPVRVTIDTGVDAYSHALESYFCINKLSPFSELLALEAMRILGPEIKNLASDSWQLLYQNRANLLYGSLLGGMAISVTGTTIPHTLGFSLTYFKDIPHGRANGMILPAYMYFNQRKSADPRIKKAIRVSGFDGLKQFKELMRELCGQPPCCSREEKEIFVSTTWKAPNIFNNIAVPERQDIEQLVESVVSLPRNDSLV